MKTEIEIGKFIKWGEAVSIDLTRKILKVLPLSQPEELVEIPNEDTPSKESLDLRCKSY